MKKREFIKTGTIIAVGLVSLRLNAESNILTEGSKGFDIPNLPYSSNDVRAIFDPSSFKKHIKYYKALNKSLNSEVNQSVFPPKKVRLIIQNSANYSPSLVENASGYYNHKMFFKLIQPEETYLISGKLKTLIKESFGSISEMNKEITEAGNNLRNNGWVWVIFKNGKLKVVSSVKNQNPMQSNTPDAQKGFPIICIDLFQHAYKKDYKSDKNSYMLNVLANLNWSYVEKRCFRALKYS